MATTPIDEKVLEEMVSAWRDYRGNPHGEAHRLGKESLVKMESSRREVAKFLGVSVKELWCVSGATEANNLAIKGIARAMRREGRDHVVSVVSEHACVLGSVRRLAREGFRTTFLPIDREGFVDRDRFLSVLDEKTACVSVMVAQNEIGVIQDIEWMTKRVQEVGGRMHSDGAQALGKMVLPKGLWGVDAMSFSGHKIYGPCGVGLLYVKRGVEMEPLFDGGGQEGGVRSGTVSVPLFVGMAGAVRRCEEALGGGEEERILGLRERLWRGLQEALPGVRMNGSEKSRLAGNLNVYIPLGLWGASDSCLEDLSAKVAFSRGAACGGNRGGMSGVMKALGYEEGDRGVSLRFGLGRGTTAEEIERVIELGWELGGRLGVR